MASASLDEEIPRTTRALVDDLLGPDSGRRQERVADLVRVYQPVLRRVTASCLHRFCGKYFAEADLEDIVGDEISRMLDPAQGYFRHYDPARGRLRHWIKQCIRNHTIDFLRKRTVRGGGSESDQKLLQVVDDAVNTEEVYAVFSLAMKFAEEHYSAIGRLNDFRVFVASKRGDADAVASSGLTEWKLRTVKAEIWRFIRENALFSAAVRISDQPDDVYELVSGVWDQLKNKKTVELSL